MISVSVPRKQSDRLHLMPPVRRLEGGKTSSNWLYNKYKATVRGHLAPARKKLSTLYCCSGTETAHRWNCILYKWQGGGVEWQHGVTITKVVALVSTTVARVARGGSLG